MMLYLSFPVTMFWISNQAEYFEEYVVKRKVSSSFISSLLLLMFFNILATIMPPDIIYDTQREIFPPHEEAQVSELPKADVFPSHPICKWI